MPAIQKYNKKEKKNTNHKTNKTKRKEWVENKRNKSK